MRTRIPQIFALLAVIFVVAACGGGDQAGGNVPAGPPRQGGTLMPSPRPYL